MLTKFRVDRCGAALIEFALALPLLSLLLFGVIEVSNYLLFREKLESTAVQMLDIINQNTNVDATSLNNLFEAGPDMMRPFTIRNQRIIVTQISVPIDPTKTCKPVAAWQYQEGGSRIAPKVDGLADTGSVTMVPGDHLMAIELLASYTPILSLEWTRKYLGDQTNAYTVSYALTRYGAFNVDPNTGRAVTPRCIER